MGLSRRIVSAGWIVAAVAATLTADVGQAAASPRQFTSYQSCVAAGNQLAQQGKLRSFGCPQRGPNRWELVKYA